MSVDSPLKAVQKPQARSRVTNGSKLAANVDGRSVWARRLRDVMGLYSADMPGDANEAQKSMIRRAATMTVELEELEAEFAKNGSATSEGLDHYQRTAGGLRRLLEALGLISRHTPKGGADIAHLVVLCRLAAAIREGAGADDRQQLAELFAGLPPQHTEAVQP